MPKFVHCDGEPRQTTVSSGAAGVVSSTLFKGYGLERGFESLEYCDPGGPEPSKVTERALRGIV